MMKTIQTTAVLLIVLIASGCSTAAKETLSASQYLAEGRSVLMRSDAELRLMPYGVRIDSSGFTIIDIVLVGRHPELLNIAKQISLRANAHPREAIRLSGPGDHFVDEAIQFVSLRSASVPRRHELRTYEPGPTVKQQFVVATDGDQYAALIPVYIQPVVTQDLLRLPVAIELDDTFPWQAVTGARFVVDTSAVHAVVRSLDID